MKDDAAVRSERVSFPGRAAVALVVATWVWAAAASCGPAESPWVSPVHFDTATAWFHMEGDSVSLLVEIASSAEQRAFGLSRRPSLDAASGMLFEFDTIRSAEHGFWMWRTNMPLDIAFIDEDGVVRQILGMEVCGSRAESCPEHPPGVEYSNALEANLGWFAENGVEVGDRVSIVRR